MAKGNKYATINFNDFYDNKVTANPSLSSSSSSSSSTQFHQKAQFASVTKNNGRMLVLTRPFPKPYPIPTVPIPSPVVVPDAPPQDSISLRPLGSTGSRSSLPELSAAEVKPLPPLKVERFVPPHLRPGFVPQKQPSSLSTDSYSRRESGRLASPNTTAADSRPKSSGYERVTRTGYPFSRDPSQQQQHQQPFSAFNRPRSTGCDMASLLQAALTTS